MSVEVRRVRPDDWPRTKALRLEALADTPIGFLETLAEAQQLGDDTWRARAARGAAGGDAFQVLAEVDGRLVGSCVSFVRDGRAWLVAVYLSPDARGQGLLAAVVAACAQWAREQGAPELVLEVHEANSRARAAYARLGFVATGVTRPYPLEAGGLEREMALPVTQT